MLLYILATLEESDILSSFYKWHPQIFISSPAPVRSEIIEVDDDQINDTLLDTMYIVSENTDTNTTVFLKEYPCEWGFHYLTSGAAVWLAFLPFYITQLLGNCWRQCCCCLCDPLVMNLYHYSYRPFFSIQDVIFL